MTDELSFDPIDPDQIDPDDLYEWLQEMHRDIRNYLFASDIIAFAEIDRNAAREAVAALTGLIQTGEGSMRHAAMILHRVPETAGAIAESLEELANSTSAALPFPSAEDEEL